MKKPGKVFISHSSKDKDFVDQLVVDLAAHEIPVWYDKLDIQIGDSIPGSINDGLADADYFMIILSPDAIASVWVREELNAALMRQINSNGTFVIPILYKDCNVPPLLAHRRYVDFRSSYQSGMEEVLSVWGKDAEARKAIKDKILYPWPDLKSGAQDFVYLYSTRFDKFFRMNCDLTWTVTYTVDYITEILKLPWNKELPSLGMRWSFSYGLVFNEQGIPLSKSLCEAGIMTGNTIFLNIRGTYEDLYEQEIHSMWDGNKMYEITSALKRDANINQAIHDRGPLTDERVRLIANSCFSHLNIKKLKKVASSS